MKPRLLAFITLLLVVSSIGLAVWLAGAANAPSSSDNQKGTDSARDGRVCIQVVTDARNPETGEVRTFPTPCDVPEGWQIIESASLQ